MADLTKIYEGADLSGATNGVVYLPILRSGTLEAADVFAGAASAGAAVFEVRKNNVVVPGLGALTIPNGAKIGSVTGLSIALLKGDEIVLNLVSGSVSAPITLNLIVNEAAADADAEAFIEAAALTDETQKTAIRKLVKDLKAALLWDKLAAIYPFVGGTAASHKWNLRDARDLDAAFRLTFNGGWTHGSGGAQPNGTTGYADTKLIPSQVLEDQDRAHLSFYSRTNDLTGSQMPIGSNGEDGTQVFQLNITSANGVAGDVDSVAVFTPANTLGFFVVTRAGARSLKVFQAGVLKTTDNVEHTGIVSAAAVWIGARNLNGFALNPAVHQCAFASIGDGLTRYESAKFQNIVQAFQVGLNRAV